METMEKGKKPETTADYWAKEMANIEKFYKEVFNTAIDWSQIVLPLKREGLDRLEVVLDIIDEDETFNAYDEYFGPNGIQKNKEYYNLIGSIRGQQGRPCNNYGRAICHVGGTEADLLNMSYGDGIGAGVKFMTLKEGLVSAFRARFETGVIYDTIGLTRFATLNSKVNAMTMHYSDLYRKALIGWCSRDLRFCRHGLREVHF